MGARRKSQGGPQRPEDLEGHAVEVLTAGGGRHCGRMEAMSGQWLVLSTLGRGETLMLSSGSVVAVTDLGPDHNTGRRSAATGDDHDDY